MTTQPKPRAQASPPTPSAARVAAGVREGGQFATSPRSEPDLSLLEQTDRAAATVSDEVEQMWYAQHGDTYQRDLLMTNPHLTADVLRHIAQTTWFNPNSVHEFLAHPNMTEEVRAMVRTWDSQQRAVGARTAPARAAEGIAWGEPFVRSGFTVLPGRRGGRRFEAVCRQDENPDDPLSMKVVVDGVELGSTYRFPSPSTLWSVRAVAPRVELPRAAASRDEAIAMVLDSQPGS